MRRPIVFTHILRSCSPHSMPVPSSPEPAPRMEVPDQAPVMVLPECNLLPHGLLPLFIFESRYRDMLRDALMSNRLFCIGMRKPDADADADADNVFEHSTLGLIRASVLHDDGTSHLVLQGIRRVRFVDWIDNQSYPVARLEPVQTSTSDPVRAKELLDSTLELLQELATHGEQVSEILEGALVKLSDPDVLSDVLAYNLIQNAFTRQHLLECADPCERLEFLRRQLSNLIQEQSSS
jgi:Lon protease-like protein